MMISVCALSFANAQTVSRPVDNSDSVSVTLDEVVVKAPEFSRSANSSSYYPTGQMKEKLTTSSQLLAGLQIPELIVNPATGDISVSGGGKLSIRINGRAASQTDLMSIASKNITKVEYITNPGVRYGEAAGVLEITVRKKSEGFGIISNILQSANRGWGDYTAGLKYSIGRSEWSIDYHSNPMWQMDSYRDNRETIDLGEAGIVSRRENGIKTPNRMVTHRGALQYSYAAKSGLLFNVQARLFRQNDKYVSAGNITTDYNGTVTEAFEKETAPFTSWQGDLDLYLHLRINQSNKLYFNFVPTLLTSTSNRTYESEDIYIDSKIKTNGYMFLAEGVWEKRISRGTLTSGIRGFFKTTKADYITYGTTAKENSFDGHCFVEWSQNLGKVSYSTGIDGSWFSLKTPVSRNCLGISPKLSVRYAPLQWGGICCQLEGNMVNPTLSQLTPAMQQIDRFQYSVGSAALSPYFAYKTSLEFDFNVKDIQGKLSVSDKYSRHPIMGIKWIDDGKIIQSFQNGRYHNDFIIKGQVRMPIIIKQLTLSIEGGWHRMISRGTAYRHTYSQPFVNAQLMYMSGNWWIMAKYNNAYNMLWGEMITTINNNLLNIGVGYRYKSATFMAGIVNPVGNVSLKSRDLSAIAGYDRTYHAASSNCLVWVGATINFFHGNRRSATQKKLDNNTQYETIKNVQK